MFEPDGEEHETSDFLGGNEKSFQSLRQRFGQILSLYLLTSFLWGEAFCPHVHSECLETPIKIRRENNDGNMFLDYFTR